MKLLKALGRKHGMQDVTLTNLWAISGYNLRDNGQRCTTDGSNFHTDQLFLNPIALYSKY